MSQLPLNDSEVFLINRDIALFLGVLAVLAMLFKLSSWRPKNKVFLWIFDFISDSWKELWIIFILRAFFYEMYIIPSGSMQPTVYAGDVVLVNKYQYGWKFPGTNRLLMSYQSPQRGDVIVFLDPQAPTQRKMIKRLIAIGGDHIQIQNNQIRLNGQLLEQGYTHSSAEYFQQKDQKIRLDVSFYQSHIDAHSFSIQHISLLEDRDLKIDFDVPVGYYFVMGDNRENSKDSRYIGLVPERFVCGKAERVLMSFGRPFGYYDFSRVGALS